MSADSCTRRNRPAFVSSLAVLLLLDTAGCRRSSLVTADGGPSSDAAGESLERDAAPPPDLTPDAPVDRPPDIAADQPIDAPPETASPGLGCGFRACHVDEACVQTSVSVFNCVACGDPGGYCCIDGRCAGGCCMIVREAPAGRCMAADSPACQGSCGLEGKPCCGSACLDSRTVCDPPEPRAPDERQICRPCGLMGQPCCSLANKVLPCHDGLACQGSGPGTHGFCLP